MAGWTRCRKSVAEAASQQRSNRPTTMTVPMLLGRFHLGERTRLAHGHEDRVVAEGMGTSAPFDEMAVTAAFEQLTMAIGPCEAEDGNERSTRIDSGEGAITLANCGDHAVDGQREVSA